MYKVLSTGLAVILLLSCKSGTNQPGEKKEDNKSDTVALAQTTEISQQVRVSAPKHINKAEFLELVMDYEKNTENWVFKGDKPCLIDFYADWCGPCKITSPILEDLAGQYAGKINIYKVDVDKEQELAAIFGIQSIPTFLFCPLKGDPTLSSGIARSPEATRDMFIQQIDQLLLKHDASI